MRLAPEYENIREHINIMPGLISDDEYVAWAPQKGPQTTFLQCPVYEVLYGGSAGGSKSESLLIDYTTDVHEFGKAWKGILFRKTNDQLDELITRSQTLYPILFEGAKYLSGSIKKWTFPSGATLKFRAINRPSDCVKYMGPEYTWMGFDELTHYSSAHEYGMLKTRVRSPIPNIPKRIRSTANPGFIGHQWVKSYFIDNGPFNVITNKQGMSRTFIPARLEDNKMLDLNDPSYRKELESIKDPMMRRALLDGDWDVIIGAALEGAWQAQKHIIPPFSPPSNWFCDRSLDWGSSHPFSINYYCVSNGEQLPDGRIYPTGAVILFHELYGVKTKDNGAPDPNVGVRWSAEQIANEMKLIENAYYSKSGCIIQPGPADLDIFTKQDNHCIYDNFYKNGIGWTKAQKGPGSRATGLHLMIELLSQEPPLFYVTSNCLNWLRTVPSLVRDKNNWEVVEKKGEDHAYDSTRYRLLANAPFVPNSNGRFWK